MILTTVKNITLPEGKASRIIRKSDGAVLWKKGYTNQIPISTNEDGTLCVGANGEKGYLLNKRCSVSGGGVVGATGYSVTGLIPAKYNDVLRVKNIKLDDMIILYNSERKIYGRYAPSLLFGGTPEADGTVSETILNKAEAGSYAGFNDVAYIRINSSAYMTADSVVTINEEITS